MEGLLLELLGLLLEFLIEALLQFAGGAILDGIFRAMGAVFSPDRPIIAAFAYAGLGALVGSASLVLFPHPLVKPSRFHGISLLISPLFVGSAMSLLGSFLESKNKKSIQIESFGYGFAFAFGMALVRLVFAG